MSEHDTEHTPLVPAAASSSQYEGEDVRPTTEKELRGFYAYSWASEVFVLCGMASFIPITLEQLAREKAYIIGHPDQPCLSSPPVEAAFSAHTGDAAQCVLPIFGTEINTASFAMYTFSLSVFMQFIVIISMSGAADHGKYRKSLLIGFTIMGSVATMLFFPFRPNTVILAALFAIVANTCYGASSVLLNSFLPVLVRNHPRVRLHHITQEEQEQEDGEGDDEEDDEDEEQLEGEENEEIGEENDHNHHYSPITKPLDPRIDTTSPSLALSTHISAMGIGLGYFSALLLQMLAIYIVYIAHSSLWSLRLVLFLIGLWWLIFSIPAALWLRPRPGPPLHLPTTTTTTSQLLAYLTYSWRSLTRSILRARQLRDVLLFLAAWFVLSDAIATVSGTAVLFAKTSLRMAPPALALITVTVTLAGIAGALLWPRLARLMGLAPTHTVLLCIAIFELVPLYGLAGYIPAVQRWGVGGLQQAWEMYPVACVYGFVLGGVSSFCRGLFAELVPPGFEAAFYALYAITDKGSSVFGPAVVGAITDRTGAIRPAFFFLALLVAAPFPLLAYVDIERGKAEGEALAKQLQANSDED